MWLIDPLAKTLEALRLEGGKWTIEQAFGGNDVVRVAPFDAVDVKLARLWGEG